MKKLLTTLAGRRILVLLYLLGTISFYLIFQDDKSIRITGCFLVIIGNYSSRLFHKTSLWRLGIFEKRNNKNKKIDERILASNSIAYRYSYFTIATIGFLTYVLIILSPLYPNIYQTLIYQVNNPGFTVATCGFIVILPDVISAWREKDVEIIKKTI